MNLTKYVGEQKRKSIELRKLATETKDFEKSKELKEEKQELIDYLKEELKKLEINRMDFSIDYYVDRKSFLNEILSKIEKE